MSNRIVAWIVRHQKVIVLYGVAFLCLYFVVPYLYNLYESRKRYNWSTYVLENAKENKEPFGYYYFKDYIKDYWKGEFVELCDTDCYAEINRNKPCNYLILNQRTYYNPLIDDLIITSKGSRIIYACSIYMPNLMVEPEYSYYFDIDSFEDGLQKRVELLDNHGNHLANVWEMMLQGELKEIKEAPTIVQTGRSVIEDDPMDDDSESFYDDEHESGYNEVNPIYAFFSKHGIGSFKPLALTHDVLYERDRIHAMQRGIGRGKITLISSPFLFSNYGISTDDTRHYIEYLMDETFDSKLPLVVVYPCSERYRDNYESNASDTIFYSMLEHRGTRLALYLLLALLFIVIAVNVRRRRKAVVETPLLHNTSVDYVEHVSTLYNAKSDYRQLLVFEQRRLLYTLRREYRFNLRVKDFTLPSQFAPMIAQSKHLDEQSLSHQLRSIEELTESTAPVSRDSYLKAIKIIQQINT